MQSNLKKRWKIADPITSDVDAELNEFPPFMRQLLFNRGVFTAKDANEYLQCSAPEWDPYLMDGMEAAIDRLLHAIDTNEPMAVYGDYDVDGVTATALLVQVLRVMGANVREYIPNRFDEGYGLNIEALTYLHECGVRVVITVDCGIRSPREAEHASAIGLDLIISDHHHPQGEVPDAYAVICPRKEGNLYPEVNLAGVGIAYKIACALLSRHPVDGFTAEDWLDLVALGTVADIVPLKGENRVLVRKGLDRMRWGHRMGLVSLSNVSGCTISRINASDIGYSLGPRLNAAGRLESALASFDLLINTDLREIADLVQHLDDQNRERQKQTQRMQQEAERQLESAAFGNLIFAVDKNFNPGVVGLVASKLSESFYRPAIVAHQADEYTRASCRSIAEFHITKALDECADLLVRHGGHAAAAGFTVANNNLSELINRLTAIADRELVDRDIRPTLRADLEIPLSDLHPSILPWLDLLQPTGMENPDAVFVSRNLQVTRMKTVGVDGSHLKMTVSDGRISFDAIAFRFGHWAASMPQRIDLVYHFERNSYNGRESLQLRVRDLRAAGETSD